MFWLSCFVSLITEFWEFLYIVGANRWSDMGFTNIFCQILTYVLSIKEYLKVEKCFILVKICFIYQDLLIIIFL